MLRTAVIVFLLFAGLGASAQELHQENQGTFRAKVLEVLEESSVPSSSGESVRVQKIRASILDGQRQGQEVVVENDYLELEPGDSFFLHYLETVGGETIYTVGDADRRGSIYFLVGLFAFLIILFGGKQGLRSLLSLFGSLFVIVYILIPSLLAGLSPVLVSTLVAVGVLFFGIYITHGFNWESTVAFVGTVASVIITGLAAKFAVSITKLSGFATDESVYLNIGTGGILDFKGLLLGAIIIGILGVLDDIAVTQSAVVSELYGTDKTLSKKDVYKKAIRVGKEHVGALVNTLALAYTGAALPLLLLFFQGNSAPELIINSELFATEIVRTIVGSLGLVITVPITTALATFVLKDRGRAGLSGHPHAH